MDTKATEWKPGCGHGLLPGKRWCACTSWCLMLEVGYESNKWRRSSRRKGVPLAPDTLTCSHVCAQTTCRTPLKSARSQRALSICVAGTSRNGLVWKGVECCNFEYWGYWSYENVAFFSVAKYCICFEMCV